MMINDAAQATPTAHSTEAPAMLLHGGRVIDPANGIDRVGRILIRSGLIAGIDVSDGDLPDGCDWIDCGGQVVAPGLVDLGAELREPGREHDETILTGGRAALAGGFTSILCNCTTDPVMDSPATVEFVRQKTAEAKGTRIHVIAALSKGGKAEQMAELGLLAQAGAVAFSDAPLAMPNDALLKRALDYCRMLDRVVIDRPEVPGLAGQGVMHDGQVSLVLGLKGLPTEAEDLAVARDVRLAEATGGRLHVGPVTTMGAVDLLRRVKARGVKVTASACPLNLALSDVELRSYDARFKVHPPLRSPAHLETLCEAVADGTIDAIESGHMPRAREKKWNDLDLSPFGAATLETSFSLMISTMVISGRISWADLIRRMSTAPAMIAGIAGGNLSIGSPADVITVDPNEQWVVDASRFNSLCKSSPLDGHTLTGRIRRTIVGGQCRFIAT